MILIKVLSIRFWFLLKRKTNVSIFAKNISGVTLGFSNHRFTTSQESDSISNFKRSRWGVLGIYQFTGIQRTLPNTAPQLICNFSKKNQGNFTIKTTSYFLLSSVNNCKKVSFTRCPHIKNLFLFRLYSEILNWELDAKSWKREP